MKYYLIAGERSGDLHGSHLIKALQEFDSEAQFRGWGGDFMKNAGMDLVVHYKNLAFMGIWEVLTNIFTIKRYLDQCKEDLLSCQPEVLILIDYPGFNLKMAAFAHKHRIPVCYYISPKVWAWNQRRVLKIKKFVDRMYAILPFEKDFYQRFQYKVDYVGNPLVETIGDVPKDLSFRTRHGLNHQPLIAVLPGSRKQEIQHMLGLMLDLVGAFPQHNFVVAAVDNIPREYYQIALQRNNVKVVFNETYPLLTMSSAALVASGTASLETALFEVPQVVCYKTSWLTYLAAKMLVKVNYISLVNLIAGDEVVPELLQGEFNRENLQKQLQEISVDGPTQKTQLTGYRKVKVLLGTKKASRETARLIHGFLQTKD